MTYGTLGFVAGGTGTGTQIGGTTSWKYLTSADAQIRKAIWTPTTGYKFVISDLIISSDTKMSLLFEDGTTDIMKIYVPADGGAVIHLNRYIKSSTADNAFSVTASAAGNIAITAIGFEVK